MPPRTRDRVVLQVKSGRTKSETRKEHVSGILLAADGYTELPAVEFGVCLVLKRVGGEPRNPYANSSDEQVRPTHHIRNMPVWFEHPFRN